MSKHNNQSQLITEKGSNLSQIKLNAKIPHETDLMSQDVDNTMKLGKQQDLFVTETDSWSQANLFVSSVISITYAIHTIYWEYIRYNHSQSHTYQHLEVSLALSVLNLIPSLTMLMDIYSFVISIAVLIHAVWMSYHTLTVWAVELCYGAIGDGCNAIMLYKNITISLQAVVISHQILLLVTGCHKKQTKNETKRIQTILEKASQLDIQSEYEFDDVDHHVDHFNHYDVNELTISESAAEEIGLENVVKRNHKRLSKFVKRSNSVNNGMKRYMSDESIFNQDQCSTADESTFEMYGIGSPKETHGNHLTKPFGMNKLAT